jgi:2'-5' RNA ligase
MSFAVEMYFDESTEAAVRNLWKAVADAGLSTAVLDGVQRPHVTLGVCDELSANFKNALALFARELKPIDLVLSHVGCFTATEGVVFLAPTVTRPLLDLHTHFHRFFDEHAAKKWAYYLPGAWVPHCTVAFRLTPEQIPKTLQIAATLALPVSCQVREVGLLSGVGEPEKELVSFTVGQPNHG